MSSAPYFDGARFSVGVPPIRCEDGQLQAFFVSADPNVIQRLLTENLERPSGGVLTARPAGSTLVVVVARMGSIRSLTRPRSGSLEEQEVAVWVPFKRSLRGGPEQLSFFVPYMFVDSGPALSAGREGLGLPKELARIDAHAGSITVTGDSLRLPGGHVETLELLSIRPTQGRRSLRDVRDLLADPTDLAPLLRGPLTLTCLRQLPDIADPSRAAFTEVVEIPVEDRHDRRVRLLPQPHTLTFANTALHPLVDDLGVEPQTVASFGVQMQGAFTLGTGRSLARPKRQRLLVLGGGLGSLTSVFELTSQPGWQDRWQITVVQPGWRLGGKAASSRNADQHQRSEEHGLHVWFGFYRNAFELVRAVYKAADRPADHPLAAPTDAFAPQSRVHFHEAGGVSWVIDYPQSAGFPGGEQVSEHDLTAVPSPRVLLGRLIDVVVGALRGTPMMRPCVDGVEIEPPRLRALLLSALRKARLVRDLRLLWRDPEHTTLERVRRRSRQALVGHDNLALHQLGVVLDGALTMAVGLIQDALPSRGFDAIDGEDFRAWLGRHGACPEVLSSGPIKALYDAAFAYEGGDPDRPDMAAGSALLVVLRMVLTYEGAILWKTTVGMGEAIIAPLYEVLVARGVKFRFFHRVDRLALGADGSTLDAVHLTRQARVARDYQPLVEVKGIASWPAQPRFEQLEDANLAGIDASWLESGVEGGPSCEEVVLSRGTDFDKVLLGIGLGALPRICADLTTHHPRWQTMLDGLQAVRTGAVQLWLRDPIPGPQAIVNIAAGPFASWIDMSPVLATESWQTAGPRGLLHGAGVLRDTLPSEDAPAWVAETARAMFTTQHPAAGPVVAHFSRANLVGSELYERAATGTAHLRLPPWGSGVDNLVLTGAWTRTGFHIGSVEAAVMSGRLAATTLDDVPRRVVGFQGEHNA